MQPAGKSASDDRLLWRKLIPLWITCLAGIAVVGGFLLSQAVFSALVPSVSALVPSSRPPALAFDPAAKESSVDDLGFAAKFPTAPAHKDYDISMGEKTVHMSLLSATSGQVMYMAAAYETDCLLLNNDATDWLRSSTDGFKQNVEKALSATAAMTKEVPTNESGGKALLSEFVLTSKGKQVHASVKVIHTGSRLFVVAAISPREGDRSGFLRSFRIIKTPPATVNICRLPETTQQDTDADALPISSA